MEHIAVDIFLLTEYGGGKLKNNGKISRISDGIE